MKKCKCLILEPIMKKEPDGNTYISSLVCNKCGKKFKIKTMTYEDYLKISFDH